MSATSVWCEEAVKKAAPSSAAFVKASTNEKNSRGLEWLNPLTWFHQNDSEKATVSLIIFVFCLKVHLVVVGSLAGQLIGAQLIGVN